MKWVKFACPEHELIGQPINSPAVRFKLMLELAAVCPDNSLNEALQTIARLEHSAEQNGITSTERYLFVTVTAIRNRGRGNNGRSAGPK